MSFTDRVYDAALSGVQDTLHELALFDGDPDSGGSEISGGDYERKSLSWDDPSDGEMNVSVTFDVPEDSTVNHVAIYDDDDNLVASMETDKAESWGDDGTATVNLSVTVSDE